MQSGTPPPDWASAMIRYQNKDRREYCDDATSELVCVGKGADVVNGGGKASKGAARGRQVRLSKAGMEMEGVQRGK